MRDRMRETQRKIELVTGSLGLVAHADQRQFLLKAFGHTIYHVVDQGTQGTGHRIRLAAVVDYVERQGAAVVFNLYQTIETLNQRTQWTCYRDRCCSDRNFGASWDSDWHFSYSRHRLLLKPRSK